MDGDGEDDEPFWMEEPLKQQSEPTRRKRKVRSKKMEFIGWGSKPLIEFLESIGKDTSKQISQYEVTAIITEYVNANNLFHPHKKKRVLCDGRLHSLLGKKTVARIKIYDMLEVHYAENQDELDDSFLYSSEEDGESSSKQRTPVSVDRKTVYQKKKVPETPKSCFAAIVSSNIKHVYLKRTLVQDLLKDPEAFEGKVVGSFVRMKSDPNDCFQKNSHQLLQVTGVKRAAGTGNSTTEILLELSNMMKSIQIGVLSDDNFSEEECEDLRQRVTSGSIKRPTVAKEGACPLERSLVAYFVQVELQEKAQMLHEDITKHWLMKEIRLLQHLIDRANEKGWRKELFEYLERKEKLQTPSEQSRLLLEVPKVIADDIEQEAKPQETNGSPPRLMLTWERDTSKDVEANQIISNQKLNSVEATENQPTQPQGIQHLDLEECACCQGRIVQQVMETQVIEVSDDDKLTEDSTGQHLSLGDHPKRSIWHYVDPQGEVQGPFPLGSLKHWYDANYFPPDFKVWKAGQTQEDAVLLSDLLVQMSSG